MEFGSKDYGSIFKVEKVLSDFCFKLVDFFEY